MDIKDKSKIREILEKADKDVVLDAFTLLLAEKKESSHITRNSRREFCSFAEAIMYLKENYYLKELSLFSTEADLVYVDIDGRRCLLTDKSFPGKNNNSRIVHHDSKRAIDKSNVEDKPEESERFSHLEI